MYAPKTERETSAVSIRVIKANGSELVLNASLPDYFLSVGMATFIKSTEGPYCDVVYVEPFARRKSVATALHDFAEEYFGAPLVASKLLTAAGAAFLQHRGVAIPSDVTIQTWDDWFGHENSVSEDEFEAAPPGPNC